MSETQLTSLRNEMRSVTKEIFHLIGKRMSLAREIAEKKQVGGLSIINRDAERVLQEEVSKTCEEASIECDFGLRMLNSLIAESVRVQTESKSEHQLPTVTEIFSRAKQLERTGREILHLEVGQPDFKSPQRVQDEVTRALADGLANYTEPIGIPPLREKIADIFGEEYKTSLDPDQVIITVGGKLAIFLGISSVVRHGDEVIIIEPSYPAYSEFVKEVGGRPVFLSSTLEDSWDPDIEQVKSLINPTTKAIVLNTPSNPTGKMLKDSTFRAIADIAMDNEICIISDEVYAKFAQTDHTTILEYPESDHIAVQSFSKSHGMTGYRLGFAISNRNTIKQMAKLQSLLLTCAPEFIQYAAMEALDCDDEVRENAKRIQSRRELMVNLLEELPLSFHPPDGGFYVFPRLDDSGMNGRDFAEELLQETGVCVVPGAVYGRPYDAFFRIALCQAEDVLVEAIRRMGDFMG